MMFYLKIGLKEQMVHFICKVQESTSTRSFKAVRHFCFKLIGVLIHSLIGLECTFHSHFITYNKM